MRNKKRTFYAILVVFVAIIVISLAIFGCVKKIKQRMGTQVQETLVSMAQQNEFALEKELKATHDLLIGIAEDFKTKDIHNKTLLVDFLKPYAGIYHFKRMGFIENGIAYTTDGYEMPFKDMTCYEYGMAGEWYVSEKMMDSLGEAEEIHVFSVPVYNADETKIEGVLFATHKAEEFRELLLKNTKDSQIYCVIVAEDGTLVAWDDNAEIDTGIKNAKLFLDADDVNSAVIERVSKDMQEGNAGAAQISYKGNSYLYYTPIELTATGKQWYLFTVVPEEVVTKQTNPIWNDIYRLLMVIFVVLVIMLVMYLNSYHKQREMLMDLAYMDALTGGDNYACFKEKVGARTISMGNIISMDIGDFRIVNNICGEKTGNQLLQNIWKILYASCRLGEQAAHINADQFILYWKSEEQEEIVERIKEITHSIYNVVESLSIPHVEPYFGVCAMADDITIEKVYSCASQAKNNIKGRRDKNYSFYDEKLFQQTVSNKQLEDSFENAISMREFEVWYQPKYDTLDGTVVGAEALVRWRKDGELIPPYKFIPLFEKNGMIAELDEYVFKHVCEMQKQWQKEGRKIFPISINISRASLFYSGIATRYEEILESCGLDPEYVQLEITESATLENDDIDKLIEHFHKTGFRLLLDDFGNGYSSLSTLNTMKFDVLKLDKSLIDFIGDSNGEVLLRHTVELAKHFGLYVTAEGVETEDQVIFLQKVSCDDIQGYYFSKPLPEKEFEQLLSA